MKYRVNKERVWLYFVLIPFFPLKGIMEFSPVVKSFMTGWLLIAIFLILFKLILVSRYSEFRIDKNSISVIAYFLLMFLITIFVRGKLGDGLQKIIAVPFLCLLLLNYSKQKGEMLLDILANIILFNVFINCTVLCPPIFRKISGLTTNLICSIGHVQSASQIGLLGILLGIMLKSEENNRRNITLIVCSIVTMIISFTFVSGFILVFLIICYIFRKQISLILNNVKLSHMYLIMTILNIIIIAYVIHYRINFAARLGIYRVAISKILEKPILGYGVEGIKIIPDWMRWNKNAVGFNYAHNEVLQLLLDGGLMLLIANLLLIKNILKNVEKIMKAKYKYLFSVVLIAFSIIAISESVTDYNYFWTFLFILIYSKRLSECSLKEFS